MLAHKVSKNNHTIQRFWAKKCTIWCFFIFRLSITYIIYNVERRIYPRQTTRTYLGSAPRLSRKRLVLISEAPRAYLGSASCLSRKHLALLEERLLRIPFIATFIKWSRIILRPYSLFFNLFFVPLQLLCHTDGIAIMPSGMNR